MKKYLITGGLGFIGSNFIYYLFEKYGNNIRIINLDKLTYAGNIHNLDCLPQHVDYKFYKVDVCDREKVIEIFNRERPDVVVNFAAETHVDRSITSPHIFSYTNVVGVQSLLDAALKYPVEKFLQISTDEVYGSLGREGSFTENSLLMPSSPYSASKAGGDLLVQAHYKTYKLPINITRCSNNYGPYQFPEKLIPLTINNCLKHKPIPIYGNGQNVREWIYVKDHCEALEEVIQNGKIGEVYNIGSMAEISNLDLVKIIICEINYNIKKHNLPYLPVSEELINFVEDRLGHDFRYSLDISKIRQELNWKPSVKLQEGIASTVKWYLYNEDWLNKAIYNV